MCQQPGEGGDAPSEDGVSNAEEQSGAVGGVAEAPPTTHQRRTRGYPRIIKAGYGIKLGAVVRAVCLLFRGSVIYSLFICLFVCLF